MENRNLQQKIYLYSFSLELYQKIDFKRCSNLIVQGSLVPQATEFPSHEILNIVRKRHLYALSRNRGNFDPETTLGITVLKPYFNTFSTE